MLPNLSLLNQIQQRIKTLPNKKGEYLRKIHAGCFLLGYKAGLRVSEAISFNLANKTRKGLYRITKTKGGKTRLVYIPKTVISELKANNWQPNHTNRFNFYHFLKRVKRDMLMKQLGISKNVELTPHTLRRAFATYHAEAGLPLPLLQKLLGHTSIRTTALYWRNIYNEDDDTDSIITAKNWLDTNVRQKPKKPPLELKTPIKTNLEPLPELFTLPTREPLANYLTKIKDLEQKLSQFQQENNHLKEQNTGLQNNLADSNQQNTILCHQKSHEANQRKQAQKELLTTAKETIQQLTQELVRERKTFVAQKQINSNLHQKLQNEQEKNNKLQATNTNLTAELNHRQQNHTNLINTYQTAIKEIQTAEKLAQVEKQNALIQKQRADYYETQLKSIAKTLHQWQKTNYYQKLAPQNQFKSNLNNSNQFQTQIIQPPPENHLNKNLL